ncbi:MAG: diaminopimelate epimerase [Verrucomicrobiota bacterium]
MPLDFWKMNGAGNDFVVIDNRDGSSVLTTDQIALLCHRQRGVGADGLLAIELAEHEGDFRMRYYNADGGEAEMCGNGARCFARIARHLASGEPDTISFETPAGLISATFPGNHVRIALSDPFDLEMHHSLEVESLGTVPVSSINTGVPHAVVAVDDVEAVDVMSVGKSIRFANHFAPAGTNVNIMQPLDPGKIRIRTYERGVEGETLACGTGMAACALIHHQETGTPSPIEVLVEGGDTLEVDFQATDSGAFLEVFLTGPAEVVFQGSLTQI